jgi:hypothetical protein
MSGARRRRRISTGRGISSIRPRASGGGRKAISFSRCICIRVFRTNAKSVAASKIKAKGGGAPKSAVHWSRIFGCGARLAIGALAFRRSTAVLTEVSRPRHFDFRPGFLGRGPRRRYPPCACPSPAEAPRAPVVVPADMMPEAARERFARPPAGTAPAPHLRSHPECVPSMGGLFVQLSHPSPLSRKNEFAFGAFVSN